MNTSKTIDTIDHDRRRLLGMAAMGLAMASTASLLPSPLAAAPAGDAIRPFHIAVPEAQLADLRRRIAAARWPDQETVNDGSQGPQLAKFLRQL
jgi:Epoxide hydrolase N terminus